MDNLANAKDKCYYFHLNLKLKKKNHCFKEIYFDPIHENLFFHYNYCNSFVKVIQSNIDNIVQNFAMRLFTDLFQALDVLNVASNI